MANHQVHLRILGGVELTGPDGRAARSVLTQPKRLALLLYLATANPGKFHRKDTLLALFWPDADDHHARQALNRAVYFLRQELDRGVVVSRGEEELGVDEQHLECDAVAFDRALSSGAPEQALELYQGELAPGFLVSGIPGFERWLEEERTRLRERAVEAAIKLAEHEQQRGQLGLAERWAHRAMVLAPYDERAASRRIRLLDRMGGRANALRAFEELRRRLRDDLEVEPSPETLALIAAVRSRREPGAPAEPPTAASAPRAEPEERRSGAGQRRRPEPSPRRRGRWSALVGVVATVTLGLMLAARLSGHRAVVLATARAVPITSAPGIEFQPALSPDGRQVAFTTLTGGRTTITVRSAAGPPGSGEIRLASSATENQMLPHWSPDGEFIRYASAPVPAENAFLLTWKEVSRFGGESRLLNLPRNARGTAWSRDGTRAAFSLRDSIFVRGATERDTRLLAVHEGAWALHSFAWSPDGRWIAYVNGNPFWETGRNTSPAGIWLVTPESGRRIPVTDEDHLSVSPAWMDAHHLLYVSDRDGRREVYAVGIGETGPMETPVMVPGGTDAHSISVSADGKRLAVAKFVARQNVWSYPLNAAAPVPAREGRPVTSGSQVVETHDVSPDGKWLAYDTDLHGDADIYLMRLDGGTPIPLVTGPAPAFSPRWSPDGREIAYYGGPGSDIWVVSTESGTPTRLTTAPEIDELPIWSPDGLNLAFRSGATGRGGPWVVSRERIGGPWGSPRQLTDLGCGFQYWARDRSGLVCGQPDQTVLTRVSLSGRVLEHRDLGGAGLTNLGPAVSSGDGAVLYMRATRAGRPGIWAVPTASGAPRLLVPFDDPSLAVFSYPGTINVTRDRLLLTVGEFESDIWVMDLERR